ncbi:MAG: RidA family protein [Parvularculaceae bacterium]|nr:MAG: RidA family protein [Parvularculaceae bacterium]
MTPEQNLDRLSLSLPAPVAPVANYVPYVVSSNQVYISGQISIGPDGLITGKLGDDIDLETGVKAAQSCALNLISQLKAACGGDLSKLVRVVKLNGFVNSTADFTDQPKVINGASDLMVEIFGEAGKHARAAVSAPSLPLGAAVEIDGIFEIAQ